MANTTTSIFVKKYLTSEEILFIVNEMLKHDDAVGREIVKVGMVAQLVVKNIGEFEDCNGVYDYVMEKGIDLTKIVNYNTIDKLVNEELGINKIMKGFIEEFENNISKSLEKLDLNSAVKELKEIADNHDNIIDMPKSE